MSKMGRTRYKPIKGSCIPRINYTNKLNCYIVFKKEWTDRYLHNEIKYPRHNTRIKYPCNVNPLSNSKTGVCRGIPILAHLSRRLKCKLI